MRHLLPVWEQAHRSLTAHVRSQYPLRQHLLMGLASQPCSSARTGNAYTKRKLLGAEDAEEEKNRLGSLFMSAAAACKGRGGGRVNDQDGAGTHQKPEGDMPLCEKFLAARCSRPGCSSACSRPLSFCVLS